MTFNFDLIKQRPKLEEFRPKLENLDKCYIRVPSMWKMESITDETNNHFVNNKDLKILVITSIQTLKRGNKKCGREEVYRLVNDSLNKDITREAFELNLNSIIDNHSVNLNVIVKRECLSLPKESCQISDDKVDQNDINFAKKFNLFKSGIVDDFDRLKQVFFSEVNRFKEELLESNIVDRPQDTSERLVNCKTIQNF